MPDLETQIAAALVHLEYLRGDVTDIKQAVIAQNGRVRALETTVTEIKVETKNAAKSAGRNHGAGWGAGGGVVGGMLAGFIQHWLGGGK